MTEWGVVGVLIALVGLAVTLATPLIRLNTTMTRLTVLVEELSDKLGVLERETLDVCSRVNRHETRITVLEIGGKKSGDI